MRSPTSPTAQEIEEHEALGHAVHRSWCGHCVRARGLLERHPSLDEQLKAIPALSLDYFYFGESGSAGKGELPCLQVKDEHSGTVWACTVSGKGEDTFAVNFVLGCLDECGYKRIILRSDNEPSVKALKQKVKTATSVEVVLEEGKTGDSRSMGSVEAAVKETKRQCRAMKSSLQEKLGIELVDGHHVLTWLARHGAFLISRYRVGADGRTPYERLKGKAWRRPMVTFGERVWFRPLRSYTSGRSDLAPKLDAGVYVGTHGRNGDVLVMTAEGVIKGGSVKRMPLESRWSAEGFDKLKGTPWKLRPQAVGDIDAAVRIELPEVAGRLSPEPAGGPTVPRSLYVRRRDVEGNFTLGCAGCIALQTDMPARSHSAECRTLVAQRLMGSAEGRIRVEAARKRKDRGAEEPALEDVPDMDEEVHAPSAVGQPEGRVEPLVRPDPVVRKAEEQPGEESPKKSSKGEPRKGEKRLGQPLEELHESVAVEEAASSSASGGPSQLVELKNVHETKAKVEAAINCLELAMVLQERAFPEEEFQVCRSIGLELMGLGIGKTDVAEIYNPERFTSRANEFGLKAGFAIDLEIQKNAKGEHWDLSRESDQRTLFKLQDEQKPALLIGSPPCDGFSPLQNLTKHKRSAEENERLRETGREHLRVAIRSYWKQVKADRMFLHEHPKGASSWSEPEMVELMSHPTVFAVQGPMCRWHMKSEDGQGVGFVRKETQFITNSAELARVLSGKCSGTHRHVHLINGRARKAQVYPPRMVSAILRALKKELHQTGEFNELTAPDLLGIGPSPDAESNESAAPKELEADWMESAQYFDSVSGAPLKTERVLEARQEELKWVHK